MPHRPTDAEPSTYAHLHPKHKPVQIVAVLAGVFMLLTSGAMWGLGRRPATDLSALVPKASASAPSDDAKKATPTGGERPSPGSAQNTAHAQTPLVGTPQVSTTLVRAKASTTP